MNKNHSFWSNWRERIILAGVFIALGSLIMLVFSPWQPLLDPVEDYLGRLGVITVLLLVIWVIRRTQTYRKYLPVLNGLLILVAAVSLDWIIGNYYVDTLGLSGNNPINIAFQKLNECAVILSVVISLTYLSGGNLASIYIQKGNLQTGLRIGLIAFVVSIILSVPMANSLFNAHSLTITRIMPWIPWILIFVLANAALEEILFRGLFLRKLEPFFGKFASNFLVALVFTVIHGTVSYTADQYLFLAILFPLALVWGYLMQNTEGVWSSILFHAGGDIAIILGIFSNL